jgi:hypothetical protein
LTSLETSISRKDSFSTQAGTVKNRASSRSPAETCTRIRELGFTTSRHIKMYGQRFELVSDPFEDGKYTAVHALSGSDPTERTVRLPVALLTGLADQFRTRETPVQDTPLAVREAGKPE